MSRDNVAIAKRSMEALTAARCPCPEWVEESAYRGHDGFRKMAVLYADNFDDFAIRIEEFRDLGDRVVELGEITGRIKGTGVIRQPLGMVLSDFRDGKIGEGRNFLTRRQALEAVELRE